MLACADRSDLICLDFVVWSKWDNNQPYILA